MSRLLPLLSLLLLTLVTGLARPQEPAYREDLRFIEKLRERRDHNLALEYIKRLEKGASPELARELLLEKAISRMASASDEPDTTRRLASYRAARLELEGFIARNPGSPRLADANLELARTLNLLGQTELGRAKLLEPGPSRTKDAVLAQATLQQANKRMGEAVEVLEKRLEAMPEPGKTTDKVEARRRQLAIVRARERILRTRLDMAMNLYEQSQTYIITDKNEQASKMLEKARDQLSPLANKGVPGSPVTWRARAVLGRVVFELETGDKGRVELAKVLSQPDTPVTREGKRLAYFYLMQIINTPNATTTEEKKAGVPRILLKMAESWRKQYAADVNTPEGHGVTYLLAETLLGLAGDPKLKGSKTYRARARDLLRELESSENQYSDRARVLKIRLLAEDGAFERAVKTLKTFEECWARAQFEMEQIKKANEAKSAEEAKKKREPHVKTLIQALERGLTMKDAKTRAAAADANRARLALTYWSLLTQKYEEAIKAGEAFIAEAPNSPQAALAAEYALAAYPPLLAELRDKDEAATAEARVKFIKLARLIERLYKDQPAGDSARHEIGLLFWREGNLTDALRTLSRVSVAYPRWPLVQLQIAMVCGKAEGDSIEPLPGDQKGDYQRRALFVLQKLPDSSLGSDPEFNNMYVRIKVLNLATEYYRSRRYNDLEGLVRGTLKRLDDVQFAEFPMESSKRRNELRSSLTNMLVLGIYGQIHDAFTAHDHARVMTLVEPLVAAALKEGSAERAILQRDGRLASSTFGMGLQSAIQTKQVDKANAILRALDAVAAEDGGGDLNILRQLAFLIGRQVDELKKSGDKEALRQAVVSYKKLLGERIRLVKGKPPPDFFLALADCYSSMGEHGLSASELAKIILPAKAAKGSPEERLGKVVQIKRLRELRLSGTKKHLIEADKVMKEVLDTWGQRDLNALKEYGMLLEAKSEYSRAFALWTELVKKLRPAIVRDNRLKEAFLESYYHAVRCMVKNSATLKTREERDGGIKRAAQQMIELERNWEGFGSDTSRARFEALLAEETALREMYQKLRKGR